MLNITVHNIHKYIDNLLLMFYTYEHQKYILRYEEKHMLSSCKLKKQEIMELLHCNLQYQHIRFGICDFWGNYMLALKYKAYSVPSLFYFYRNKVQRIALDTICIVHALDAIVQSSAR